MGEGRANHDRPHWSSRYAVRKWDTMHFNCWHFFRAVYRDELGIELPAIDTRPDHRFQVGRDFKEYANRQHDWVPVEDQDRKCEYDGVAIGSRNSLYHVGVWTEADGGKIVHCNMDQGVTVMSVPRMMELGYDLFRFYRHADNFA